MKTPKLTNKFKHRKKPTVFGTLGNRYVFEPLGSHIDLTCIICNTKIHNLSCTSSFWLYSDEFLQDGKWFTIFCCAEHKELYELCPPV